YAGKERAEAEARLAFGRAQREQQYSQALQWLRKADAIKANDVREAGGLYAKARDYIHPRDARKDERLRQLREEAASKHRQTQDYSATQMRYRKLVALRDEAFFQLNIDVIAGPELSNARAAQKKALEALGLFGLSIKDGTGPDLTHLTADEKKSVT